MPVVGAAGGHKGLSVLKAGPQGPAQIAHALPWLLPPTTRANQAWGYACVCCIAPSGSTIMGGGIRVSFLISPIVVHLHTPHAHVPTHTATEIRKAREKEAPSPVRAAASTSYSASSSFLLVIPPSDSGSCRRCVGCGGVGWGAQRSGPGSVWVERGWRCFQEWGDEMAGRVCAEEKVVQSRRLAASTAFLLVMAGIECSCTPLGTHTTVRELRCPPCPAPDAHLRPRRRGRCACCRALLDVRLQL